jgi:DNA repair photolyase
MYKKHLTFNPIGGECSEHKCTYCYVDDMKTNEHIKKKYSGEPRLIEKELKENLYKYGEGITIFIQNMSDLFADNVPYNIILSVLHYCNVYPNNIYLFQTKNPSRFNSFHRYEYPPFTIKATTIETNRDTDDISGAPNPSERMSAMASISGRRQITIEPILMFDIDKMTEWMRAVDPEIIYIGADSKRHNLPEPTEREVVDLYGVLKPNFDVRLKPNLRRLAPSLF